MHSRAVIAWTLYAVNHERLVEIHKACKAYGIAPWQFLELTPEQVHFTMLVGAAGEVYERNRVQQAKGAIPVIVTSGV